MPRPEFTPGEVPPEVQKALDKLEFDGEGATPLSQLGAALHESTAAYEEVGFLRKEALYMTAALFTGNPGIAPGI